MRKDRKGIEGLPLRLMLVAILLSLTVPMMIATMESATNSIKGREAAGTAEEIARLIERMAAGGPGNVRLVEVPTDLPAGVAINVGGSQGSGESMRVSWVLDGKIVHRYLDGATVLTSDGQPLILSPGDSLRLCCPANAWGVVEATRA